MPFCVPAPQEINCPDVIVQVTSHSRTKFIEAATRRIYRDTLSLNFKYSLVVRAKPKSRSWWDVRGSIVRLELSGEQQINLFLKKQATRLLNPYTGSQELIKFLLL